MLPHLFFEHAFLIICLYSFADVWSKVGIFWADRNHIKSAAILFTKQTTIDPESGPQNEILCIIEIQGAGKLR